MEDMLQVHLSLGFELLKSKIWITKIKSESKIPKVVLMRNSEK